MLARIRTVFVLGLGVLLLAGCLGEGGSLTTTPSSTPPAVTLALTSVATGATTTTVSAGGTVNVTARLTDAAGVPVAGAILSFSVADGSLAKLTPASGTALTDATGTAVVKLDAAGISSAGATTVSVSGSVSSGTTATAVTASKNFTVGPANVTLSSLAAAGGVTALSAYATAGIEVSVGGVSTSTPVSIAFSSVCANSGKATITPLVNSANGKATATYADKGCAQTDTITASVSGTSTSTSMTLAVAAPSAASIQFVSASPELIVLKGTGGAGLVESSVVKFKLLDNSNQPIVGANVVFDLTTRAGGILLDSVATGTVTKQTDATGQASVSVSSGTVPTAVWVTASHTSGGADVSSQSTKLQISTGVPSQDRFSLSAETPVIEGWDFDGVTTKLTVIASDRLGNPVPDGTAINFISSGGQIGTGTSGICTTVAGTCSATFTSAKPKQRRVAVVAYTLGEESFRDKNGDNKYVVKDEGDSFTDLGDVFIDTDFNGDRSDAETRIGFDTTKPDTYNKECKKDGNMSTEPGVPSMATTCDGSQGKAHVRRQVAVALSSVNGVNAIWMRDDGSKIEDEVKSDSKCSSIVLKVDLSNDINPLPSGSQLSVEGLNSSGWSATISPSAVVAPSIPYSKDSVTTRHTVTITFASTSCDGTKTLQPQIKIVSPMKAESSVGGPKIKY